MTMRPLHGNARGCNGKGQTMQDQVAGKRGSNEAAQKTCAPGTMQAACRDDEWLLARPEAILAIPTAPDRSRHPMLSPRHIL